MIKLEEDDLIMLEEATPTPMLVQHISGLSESIVQPISNAAIRLAKSISLLKTFKASHPPNRDLFTLSER